MSGNDATKKYCDTCQHKTKCHILCPTVVMALIEKDGGE